MTSKAKGLQLAPHVESIVRLPQSSGAGTEEDRPVERLLFSGVMTWWRKVNTVRNKHEIVQ
jgi:hypothetical protein